MNYKIRKKIICVCEKCGSLFERRSDGIKRRTSLNKPLTCTSCSNSIAGKEKWKNFTQEERQKFSDRSREIMTRTRGKESDEERSIRGKRARASVKADQSTTVRKQWDTIRKDPEKYEKACKRLKKLGIDQWENLSPEEKEERCRKCFSDGRRSKPNKELHSELEKLGLSPIPEMCIRGYFADEVIQECYLVIEFFGTMYHCDPRNFSDPYSYCSWISRTVKEQWDRDKRRIEEFKVAGYKVLIIWEMDWNLNKTKEIERVLYEINQYRTSLRTVSTM